MRRMNMNALQTFFLANKVDAKKPQLYPINGLKLIPGFYAESGCLFGKGRRLQSDHREHATLSKQEGKTKHNVPD